VEDAQASPASDMPTDPQDPRRPAKDVVEYVNLALQYIGLLTRCCSHFNIDGVTFSIGEGHTIKNFVIHRSLACGSSKLLHRELNGTVPASTYRVPFGNLQDLNIYIDWLYSGTVATKKQDPRRLQLTGQAAWPCHYNEEYLHLAQLYVLSVKLEDHSFANAIKDAFLGALRESSEVEGNAALPSVKTITWIWANVDEADDLLKQLVMKTYATLANKDNTLEDAKWAECPAQFTSGVMQELFELRLDPDDIVVGDNCDFHIHSDGKTCPTGGPAHKRRRMG